ncbi:MAG: DUF4159 domain-containing protein [Kiritimatiellia bacterium]
MLRWILLAACLTLSVLRADASEKNCELILPSSGSVNARRAVVKLWPMTPSERVHLSAYLLGPHRLPAGRFSIETVRPWFVRDFCLLHLSGWPEGVSGRADLVVHVHVKPRASGKELLRRFRIEKALSIQRSRMDVVLMIDDSYSMRRNDPERFRATAAGLFAEIARACGEVNSISVISFARTARLLLGPAPPSDKKALDEALNNLKSRGQTDMDPAVTLACRVLDETGNTRKIALLLSDGRDEPGRYEQAHRLLAARRVPVYTVGLSGEADVETLRRIAADTGGKFFFAPTAEELSVIFREIAFSIHHRVGVTDWNTASTNRAVPIDDSIRMVIFELKDAEKGTKIVVEDPEGGSRALVSGRGGGNSVEFFAPTPGEWILHRVAGARGRVRVTASSDLELFAYPFAGGLPAGEDVEAACLLMADGAAIESARVTARIAGAEGTFASRVLYDDGKHADTAAGDGIYAGRLSAVKDPGTYVCEFTATGTTKAGFPFERRACARLGAEPAPQKPSAVPVADTRPPPPRETEAPAEKPLPLPPAPESPRDAGILYRALIMGFIAAVLILIISWLTKARAHIPPMARYLTASAAAHLLVFLLTMNTLLETGTVKVEDLPRGIAVKVRAVEDTLGFRITPPGKEIEITETETSTALDRKVPSESYDSRKLFRPAAQSSDASAPASEAAAITASMSMPESENPKKPAEQKQLRDSPEFRRKQTVEKNRLQEKEAPVNADTLRLPPGPEREAVSVSHLSAAKTGNRAVKRKLSLDTDRLLAGSFHSARAIRLVPDSFSESYDAPAPRIAVPGPAKGSSEKTAAVARPAARGLKESGMKIERPGEILPADKAALYLKGEISPAPVRTVSLQGGKRNVARKREAPEINSLLQAVRHAAEDARSYDAKEKNVEPGGRAVLPATPEMSAPQAGPGLSAAAYPAADVPGLQSKTAHGKAAVKPDISVLGKQSAPSPDNPNLPSAAAIEQKRQTGKSRAETENMVTVAEASAGSREESAAGGAPVSRPAISAPEKASPASALEARPRKTTSRIAFSIKKEGARAESASLTMGLGRYAGGDWSCSKTAMMYLSYQVEERTGTALEASDKVVDLSEAARARVPFIYMTGHRDFAFTPAERRSLRAYLKGGGHLWADDSTHFGDERFDTAFRREISLVLPDHAIEKLDEDFKGFTTGYNLREGYMGYAIPPGDKYRLDYIEGIRIGGRAAVVYTRNDYGDGLNIDPDTHPLKPSLTDLSPAEMQEGAVRMGVNLALYFLSSAQDTKAEFMRAAGDTLRQGAKSPDETPRGKTNIIDSLEGPGRWAFEDWGDGGEFTAGKDELGIRFRLGEHGKTAFSTGLDKPVEIISGDSLALDARNHLPCGMRLALAFDVGGTYYESRPFYLKPGANTAFFDMSEKTFKTEESGWKYEVPIPSGATIKRLTVLIYSPKPGRVTMKNLRVIRKSADQSSNISPN